MSQQRSVGDAAQACTQTLALGLTEVKAKMATNYDYIHACQIIYPQVKIANRSSAKVSNNRLEMAHWTVCNQSHSVKSTVTNKANNIDQQVEISLWVHSDIDRISTGWMTERVKAGESQVVVRPVTHQLTITIKPGIQLSNEPCSIGIEIAGSVQIMHRTQLGLKEDGCTRIILTESYKVKDFVHMFSKEKCFGLLVFQGNKKKWAQFFPQMQGFDKCQKEMNNKDYLPPANAA